MEQELNLPYDRALSEAVWRRVAPELTPFAPLPAPEEREACCMAAPTEDGLVRVQRFIDEEVSMARAYRCHARSAAEVGGGGRLEPPARPKPVVLSGLRG